jgi:hypothetical protein
MRVTTFSTRATVLGSAITRNQGGGAIASPQENFTISNSTIRRNTGGGGALRLSHNGLISVRNSTLFDDDGEALVLIGGSSLCRAV